MMIEMPGVCQAHFTLEHLLKSKRIIIVIISSDSYYSATKFILTYHTEVVRLCTNIKKIKNKKVSHNFIDALRFS